MTKNSDILATRMTQAHVHMPQGVAKNYRDWGEDQTVFVDQVQGRADGWACPHCGSALRSENEASARGPVARYAEDPRRPADGM